MTRHQRCTVLRSRTINISVNYGLPSTKTIRFGPVQPVWHEGISISLPDPGTCWWCQDLPRFDSTTVIINLPSEASCIGRPSLQLELERHRVLIDAEGPLSILEPSPSEIFFFLQCGTVFPLHKRCNTALKNAHFVNLPDSP